LCKPRRVGGLARGTEASMCQFATLTEVRWHTSGEVVLMGASAGHGHDFRAVPSAAPWPTQKNLLPALRLGDRNQGRVLRCLALNWSERRRNGMERVGQAAPLA
jgi:hypothetical protein